MYDYIVGFVQRKAFYFTNFKTLVGDSLSNTDVGGRADDSVIVVFRYKPFLS